MKGFATIAVLLLLLLASSCGTTGGADSAQGPEDAHRPGDTVASWETALQYLKDGNRHYLDETAADTSCEADRAVLRDGQQPFAVVLTCSDSRVPPELIFHQALGDLFVIRNAGNIADGTALGSIEYAVEHLGVPLLVVLGHSSCGAVTAAYEGGEAPEHLQGIIDTIAQHIEDATGIDDAILRNVDGAVESVEGDEIVHELEVKVIGALYDIESGEVTWLA